MKRYIYLVLLALVANIASIRANEPLKREFRGICTNFSLLFKLKLGCTSEKCK